MKTFAFTSEGLQQAHDYTITEQIKDFLRLKNTVIEHLLLLAILIIISQLIVYASPITTIAYKTQVAEDAITLFKYLN